METEPSQLDTDTPADIDSDYDREDEEEDYNRLQHTEETGQIDSDYTSSHSQSEDLKDYGDEQSLSYGDERSQSYDDSYRESQGDLESETDLNESMDFAAIKMKQDLGVSGDDPMMQNEALMKAAAAFGKRTYADNLPSMDVVEWMQSESEPAETWGVLSDQNGGEEINAEPPIVDDRPTHGRMVRGGSLRRLFSPKDEKVENQEAEVGFAFSDAPRHLRLDSGDTNGLGTSGMDTPPRRRQGRRQTWVEGLLPDALNQQTDGKSLESDFGDSASIVPSDAENEEVDVFVDFPESREAFLEEHRDEKQVVSEEMDLRRPWRKNQNVSNDESSPETSENQDEEEEEVEDDDFEEIDKTNYFIIQEAERRRLEVEDELYELGFAFENESRHMRRPPSFGNGSVGTMSIDDGQKSTRSTITELRLAQEALGWHNEDSKSEYSLRSRTSAAHEKSVQLAPYRKKHNNDSGNESMFSLRIMKEEKAMSPEEALEFARQRIMQKVQAMRRRKGATAKRVLAGAGESQASISLRSIATNISNTSTTGTGGLLTEQSVDENLRQRSSDANEQLTELRNIVAIMRTPTSNEITDDRRGSGSSRKSNGPSTTTESRRNSGSSRKTNKHHHKTKRKRLKRREGESDENYEKRRKKYEKYLKAKEKLEQVDADAQSQKVTSRPASIAEEQSEIVPLKPRPLISEDDQKDRKNKEKLDRVVDQSTDETSQLTRAPTEQSIEQPDLLLIGEGTKKKMRRWSSLAVASLESQKFKNVWTKERSKDSIDVEKQKDTSLPLPLRKASLHLDKEHFGLSMQRLFGPRCWQLKWYILIVVIIFVTVLSIAIPLAIRGDELGTDPPSVAPSIAPFVFSEIQSITGNIALGNAGSSVAFSAEGNLLAVGYGTEGAVRVFRRRQDDIGFEQVGQDLLGTSPGDGFGRSVALADDGSRLVVGARSNNNGGVERGETWIFELQVEEDLWEPIDSPIQGPSTGSRSGFAVAISGDGNRIAIGSPRDNSVGTVSVFELDISDSWVVVGSIIEGQEPDELFGYALSFSENGSRLAVTAIRSTIDNEQNRGRVGVYSLDDDAQGVWTLFGNEIMGEGAGDLQGQSVALDSTGLRIAVGANGFDGEDGTRNVGACRVYDLVGSEWSQMGATLQGGERGEQSGVSVALSRDGTHVACGGPKGSENGSDSGIVRAFSLQNDNEWTPTQASLVGEEGSSFGMSCALSESGSFMAVGAPDLQVSGLEKVGAFYIFES